MNTDHLATGVAIHQRSDIDAQRKTTKRNIPGRFIAAAFFTGAKDSSRRWLAALALLASCQAASAQVLPPIAPLPTCVTDPGEVAAWFTASAITANGGVNPANSVDFPNIPNCSFYKWSWQMFLWMNSPANAGAAGRVLDSPVFYGVSPVEHGERIFIPQAGNDLKSFSVRGVQVGPLGRPIAFDKTGKMISIIRPQTGPNGKSVVRDKSGKKIEIERVQVGRDGQANFVAKSGKAIDVQRGQSGKPIVVDEAGHTIEIHSSTIGPNKKPILLHKSGAVIDFEQGQASDNAVLVAQNGSLVYYATHVNDVYAYFLTGMKNGGLKMHGGGPGVPAYRGGFPTTRSDLEDIVQFASSAGKDIRANARALTMEVKSAWVETTGLDVSQYLTITASIPAYHVDPANPTIWVRSGSRPAQLALVGMHVVGSANGHPEMIWATFEHIRNTPTAAYAYKTLGGVETIPTSTAGNWLFAASNSTPPFNVQHMQGSPGTNIEDPSGGVGPRSNAMRWKAWGAASDFAPNSLSTVDSNTEIISINTSILGQLADGDVRKNYLLMGATWTVHGAPPSSQIKGVPVSMTPGQQVGTSSLTNSTMETYQQGLNSQRGSGTNCFSCHTGTFEDATMLGKVDQGAAFGLSHIYGPLKPLFP